MNDARLVVSISAMTKTGGTYVRGVNGLGIFMFDGFRLFAGSKEKGYITSGMLFENLYKNVDSDKWTRIAANIGYDTSTTNRNTLRASAQFFSIPLKYLFNYFAKPQNVNLLEDLEIRCYLKNSICYSPMISFEI